MQDDDWIPLLTGSAADAAWDVIREIAEALRANDVQFPNGSSTGFAGGAAGIALFFHALALARPGEGFERDVARFLEEASAVEDGRLALYNGLPGVAWTVDRIAGPWDGEPDPNDELDEVLPGYLDRWPRADFDVITGLVGLGVYSLGRLPRPQAQMNVARIVRALAESAERDEDGATWSSPARPTPDGGADPVATAGARYDLGVAHGVAGVIAFLASAYSTGAGCEETGRLLADAVGWLRARRVPSFGYPAFFRPGEPPTGRSAWCYGNPGVAIALMSAGRAADQREWVQESLDLLDSDASRTPAECKVTDTSVCHGSMGLAHLYNRAFQATREPRFAGTARRWAEFALAKQRAPGKGIAGFFDSTEDAGGDPGLLVGAAGAGAVLLALVSASRPRWDGALLLDIPARRG
jgi:lantibiotic modifying enzyme